MKLKHIGLSIVGVLVFVMVSNAQFTQNPPLNNSNQLTNGFVGIGGIYAPWAQNRLQIVNGNLAVGWGTTWTTTIKNNDIEFQSENNQTANIIQKGINARLSFCTGSSLGFRFVIGESISHFTTKVGIGTDCVPDGYSLAVAGKIICTELKVKIKPTSTCLGWGDYVFNSNYKLRSLRETEQYINTYKRLPDMPSAEEVHNNGIDIAEMVRLQMVKIEELTLHMIQLQKDNEELRKQLQSLKR